jgi:asparagine synthase (glutamine-hydrolysing)
MLHLKTYSGHIRNWKELCSELNIDITKPRSEREEKIILAAYEKWEGEMALHIHGMFSFAISASAAAL